MFKFLCKIGIHHWRVFYSDYVIFGFGSEFYRCKRCQKLGFIPFARGQGLWPPNPLKDDIIRNTLININKRLGVTQKKFLRLNPIAGKTDYKRQRRKHKKAWRILYPLRGDWEIREDDPGPPPKGGSALVHPKKGD